MKLVRLAAVALLVLAAAAVAGVGRPEAAQGQAGAEQASAGITVNGTGSVAVVPDVAELVFGVVTQGETARAALTANAAASRRLVAALRAAGIAAGDIQTAQVSLQPRYGENERSVRGYEASTQVTVVLRSLDRAAATIDAAVNAGANTVFGPMLRSSRAPQLYNDALKAAIADARAKARVLADAANVTLGKVTAVVESGVGPVDEDTAARAGAMDAPSIEPGTQQVVATVTVTFAIS